MNRTNDVLNSIAWGSIARHNLIEAAASKAGRLHNHRHGRGSVRYRKGRVAMAVRSFQYCNDTITCITL